MVRAQPYLIVAAAGSLAWQVDAPIQLLLIGSLQLLAFFVTAMVCHGQLAGDRPAESRLTEFYLWMSLGGVLGGLFNALVAPLLFSDAVEYPLMLAVACLLRPSLAAAPRGLGAWARQVVLPSAVLSVCSGVTWFLRLQFAPMNWGYADVPATKVIVLGAAAAAAVCLRRRPVQFALGTAVLLTVSSFYPGGRGLLLHAERSFFGVLRVMDVPLWNAHELLHGSTCHGAQSLGPHERYEPWAYYSRVGPSGRIFQALRFRRPLQADIGVLGLGAGGIAAYGQPGERITFYEIDPAVERIARNPQYFTYLTDSRAKVAVVLGDARLSLVQGPPRKFDLLVVDVFSSDSVPIHLITREAMKIYLDRLADHGLLAIHMSSRYLNMGPILGRLAEDAGVVARIGVDRYTRGGPRRYSAEWVVMARRADDLVWFAADSAWEPLPSDGGRVWTDDFSNVVAALRGQFSWDWLQVSTWWTSRKGSEASFYSSIGSILCQQGRLDEGIANFRKALDIDPDYAEAHSNLGEVLALHGSTDRAIAEFQRAVEINPAYAEAHFNLGKALADRGRLDEAMMHYQKVVAIQPNSGAHNYLGLALVARNRPQEALAHYQMALKISPDDVESQKNLAWLRATCSEASLRNSAEAVKLAERADRLSGGKRPDVLDTLAAAYAAAGWFNEALTTARKALDLARQQNHRTLAEALQSRIKLYEAGKPYRQASPSPTTETSSHP
jgi:tetratricopeptide (TPR) repeat protein